MKIFMVCSKRFYDRVPDIKVELERAGHVVTLPNCFEDPGREARTWELGGEEHAKWKAQMLSHSREVIAELDALLVLNFDKDGMKNYIGGATFLEMYDAFCLGKPVYLYNEVPEGMLKDEINAFRPIVIHGDVSKMK
ncbi:MAG: hypothetical protein UY72_C0045G0005 [Candidatus Uhrbacteria bacterium GW2011_GWD2_52_7]|uniref:Maf-like protein n=1 Tax=Candidatus Uhrbacteria bacterium GW2011_GWD2_52_7 TaxID=1618989 RepID=A0A0G2AAK5_9BACT|nr:MAG: hypothetical protein UY72_C0045G0005 [Candidatus Uhrbacteria bacterium GW2011_GWD2_52_7]